MANDQNSPHLYVCTADRKLDSRSYIVRAIRLRDLFDPNADLEQQFYWWGRYLPHGMGCALLGTEMVFGGGVLIAEERLFRREQRQRRLAGLPRQPLSDAVMRQPNMNYFLARDVLGDPNFNPNPRRYGQFQKPKPNPLLVVVEGNLYALGGVVGALPNNSPTFEVFDRKNGIWVSLQDPPLNPSLYYTHFSYATVGSRIMVCGYSAQERTPVYSYDVAPVNSLLAQPQHNELTGPFPEWVEFSPMNFPFQGRGFGLELDDDGVVQRTQKDKHFVIFTLESQPQPGKGKKRGRSGEDGPSGEDGDGSDEDELDWMIRSYLWQDGYFHTNSLKLELPTGLRHVKYSFAHSGGRNICLVIADFPMRNEVIDDGNRTGTSVRASRIMRYHVIQFEYTIAKRDYYDYVTFSLKGSRTFEDWSAGQHFISGDLLGSFVL